MRERGGARARARPGPREPPPGARTRSRCCPSPSTTRPPILILAHHFIMVTLPFSVLVTAGGGAGHGPGTCHLWHVQFS